MNIKIYQPKVEMQEKLKKKIHQNIEREREREREHIFIFHTKRMRIRREKIKED